MPQKTDKQKRQESLRRSKWNRAEKPYYKECLSCSLSCSQIIMYGTMSYDILNCPKKHKGEPAFPYKFAEMKREREEINNAGQ